MDAIGVHCDLSMIREDVDRRELRARGGVLRAACESGNRLIWPGHYARPGSGQYCNRCSPYFNLKSLDETRVFREGLRGGGGP